MDLTRRRATSVGLLVTLAAFLVYWLSDRFYDAGRGDLFYLADAFLHGRTWIDVVLGPLDVIYRNDHVYVPFGPFPAIAFMPLVAITGPVTVDQLEPGINAGLAAAVVGLAWWVAGRIGVARLRDRLALVVLLGFSTQIWWVTTRGGVWHTGHLVATILTLLLIAELFGRRRPLWLGLLIGAAFLTRAPRGVRDPVRRAVAYRGLGRGGRPRPHGGGSRVRAALAGLGLLGLGQAPALAFFAWYNADRFGSPLESGYGSRSSPSSSRCCATRGCSRWPMCR